MIDRFTGSARRAMEFAVAEARRHRHPFLAPEHILLGLIRHPDPPITRILFDLGVSATRLRQTLDGLVDLGSAEVTSELELTAAGRRALTQSVTESQRLGQRFVAPQHLLLGIVHEPATLPAQVLAQFGAGLGEVRAAVAQLPLPLRMRIPWRWRYLRPHRRRPGSARP